MIVSDLIVICFKYEMTTLFLANRSGYGTKNWKLSSKLQIRTTNKLYLRCRWVKVLFEEVDIRRASWLTAVISSFSSQHPGIGLMGFSPRHDHEFFKEAKYYGYLFSSPPNASVQRSSRLDNTPMALW